MTKVYFNGEIVGECMTDGGTYSEILALVLDIDDLDDPEQLKPLYDAKTPGIYIDDDGNAAVNVDDFDFIEE